MKYSVSGLKTVAALAAALGLTLVGPHRRAVAAPDVPVTPGDSSPGVTILSPVPRKTFTGDKPVEISAYYQAGDNNQIVAIDLYLDGVKAATQTLSAPEARGVVSFLVPASDLKPGTHRLVIRVTASDAQVSSAKSSFIFGSAAGEDPLSVAPDLPAAPAAEPANTLPQIKMVSPSLDSKVEGTVKIKVQASDPSGKSPYVTLFVDRVFKTLRNFPPYEFEWDTTAYPNGLHTIEAFAYNDAQNVSHTKAMQVYVNNPGGETSRRHDLQDAPKPHAAPAVPRSHALAHAPRHTAHAPRVARAVPPLPSLQTGAVIHASPRKKTEHIVRRPSPELLVAARLAVAPSHKSAPVHNARADEQMSHLTILGDLSNPFVTAARPAPRKPQVPTKGFKPLPPVASALLAPLGRPVGHRSLPMIRLAEARLPVDKLASPFVSAPSLRPAVLRPHRAPVVHAMPLLKTEPIRLAAHTPHARVTEKIVLGGLMRAKGQMAIQFNSTMLQLDRPLTAQGSIMFGPLRQIFEFSGGSLLWQARTGSVQMKSETKNISLTIGQKYATVNRQGVSLEAPPYISQGRTMVPLSFLPMALDVNVQFDPASGHLLITTKQ